MRRWRALVAHLARSGAAAALLGTWLAASPAAAQSFGGQSGSDEPLEINADEGIEWRRDTNQYIARGNARAAQGDMEVFADVLTAFYRPNQNGDNEIYQIHADGNVRVVTPKERVFAERGRYDVDKGVMVMTGNNLRMEAGPDVITARDTLEYWEKRKIAVARGDAVATREDKRLRADLLTAYLTEGAEGDLEIERVDADGNVEVSSPTEFVRGNKAIYYVKKEFATLNGNVRVTQGENQMNGEYAEVDLASGVSRLLSAAPGSRERDRVRGLIIPQRKPEAGSGS